MTQLSDRADQLRAELEQQSSARAEQVKNLLAAGDFAHIREWLDQWQEEDKVEDSLYKRYREARRELRQERCRQRQRQLYGSMIDRLTGKATTNN